MTPDEFGRMFKFVQIVFIAGAFPLAMWERKHGGPNTRADYLVLAYTLLWGGVNLVFALLWCLFFQSLKEEVVMAEFWYWAKIFLMGVMIVVALGSLAVFLSVMLQYRQEETEEE